MTHKIAKRKTIPPERARQSARHIHGPIRNVM